MSSDMYIIMLIQHDMHIGVDVIVYSCDRVISGTSDLRISVDNIHALFCVCTVGAGKFKGNGCGKTIERVREGHKAMAGNTQRECGKPRRDCGKSTARSPPDSVSIVCRQSDLDNMVTQT